MTDALLVAHERPEEARTRLARFGHAVFAVALAGLGVLSLGSGDFAYVWPSVPPKVPLRAVLACASGALLLACAAGLLWPRTRAHASLVLILYCLASVLLVHVPRVAMQPLEEARWFELGEIAAIVAGAWMLFATAAPASARAWPSGVVGDRGAGRARRLFGLALLPFGLSHFVYADVTAGMVPSWLPGHFAWAYLTGAGHIAAGLAILLGVLPRLAATLEGIMVSLFVLTVHVPALLRSPGSRDQWTELFVASFILGAAFLVAPPRAPVLRGLAH